MRLGVLRSLTFWLAFALAVMTARVVASPSQWWRLESPDVVVYSDAVRSDIEEFAFSYAAYRKIFTDLFAYDGRKVTPVTVLLFRESTEMEKYIHRPLLRPVGLGTFAITVDSVPLLVGFVGITLHHALELTYESETMAGLARIGYRLPLWMSQGAGEVLSTLEIDQDRCFLGNRRDNLLAVRKSEAISWNRFFGDGGTGPNSQVIFHAQEWRLMYWLLCKDTQGRERFRELAARLKKEPPTEEMLREIGGAQGDLTEEIFRFARKGAELREYPFDFSEFKSRMKVVPVAMSDVRIYFSEILTSQRRAGDAEREFNLARVEAPNSALVNEALARRELQNQNHVGALQYYRAAISAGSADPMAYLLSAQSRLDEVEKRGAEAEGHGGETAELAKQEVKRAIELNPSLGMAYGTLGRALLCCASVSEKDLDALEQGMNAQGARDWVRYYAARLAHRLGRERQAQIALQALVDDQETEEVLRRYARSVLERTVPAASARP